MILKEVFASETPVSVLYAAFASASFFCFCAASVYRKVPKIATAALIPPRGVIGFLNTATDARIITTRFTVFATECESGESSPRAWYAVWLYKW